MAILVTMKGLMYNHIYQDIKSSIFVRSYPRSLLITDHERVLFMVLSESS